MYWFDEAAIEQASRCFKSWEMDWMISVTNPFWNQAFRMSFDRILGHRLGYIREEHGFQFDALPDQDQLSLFFEFIHECRELRSSKMTEWAKEMQPWVIRLFEIALDQTKLSQDFMIKDGLVVPKQRFLDKPIVYVPNCPLVVKLHVLHASRFVEQELMILDILEHSGKDIEINWGYRIGQGRRREGFESHEHAEILKQIFGMEERILSIWQEEMRENGVTYWSMA